MKRTTILLTLLVCACVARSQTKIQFGLKAGGNASIFVGKELMGKKSVYSFHGGGILLVPFSKSFAIQTELFYSGEGGKTATTTIDMGYIRMPVLLQLRHPGGFHVEAGPQVGVLTWAKGKTVDMEVDAKDHAAPFETSIAFGMGYRFPAGIGVDLRYSVGLSDVIDGSENNLQVLGIGVSYLFNR